MQEKHDFYTTLRYIFNLQSQYVNAFRLEWLVPSLYQALEGVQKGVTLEQRYLQRFTQQIESLIFKAHKAGYIFPKKMRTRYRTIYSIQSDSTFPAAYDFL